MFKSVQKSRQFSCNCFVKVSHWPHQASLREYFENGYKQGGVFNNEDYEHDAKAWCWVHTRLGVKVPLEITFYIGFVSL